MTRSTKDRYAVGLAAALAAAVAALGCREPTAPPPPRGDLLALPAGTRVTGLGAITPDSGVRLSFDFDVNDTPAGRFSLIYSFPYDGGGVERMTVDPATDPATQILYFNRTSPSCVQFTATGRQDNGDLHPFTIDACDNASPGVGFDTFKISVPFPYFLWSGTLTEGDIVISGP